MAFFSMIIPCHNSSNTIIRLLDSLTRQGLEKEDLQVILCDDNSTDDWQELAYPYKDKLDMVFVQTIEREMHCPSNTRRDAMPYAKGEWVCFADHDDFYEDDALSKVKQFIEETNEKYCVCTILRSWNEETNVYTPFVRKQAWLHGKFYNRKNLIQPFNINFKENLYTHEDIYFNSCVHSALYKLGIFDFTYYDIPTYRWVENPKSITRNYKGKRGYLHENFQDYLVSASEPFWDMACQGHKLSIHQVIMTLLHAYFYYEAVSHQFGEKDYRDNLLCIKNFIKRILSELGMTQNEIINYVYSDPNIYALVRNDCVICTGSFIEKTSFKDFVIVILDWDIANKL